MLVYRGTRGVGGVVRVDMCFGAMARLDPSFSFSGTQPCSIRRTYRVEEGACLRLVESPLFDTRLIKGSPGSYLARFVTVRYKTCSIQLNVVGPSPRRCPHCGAAVEQEHIEQVLFHTMY